MSPLRAAALLLARMALADDIIQPAERDFLSEFLAEQGLRGSVDALLAEARDAELPTIAAALPRYADRFLVAFRLLMLARADDDFADEERGLYEAVLETFALSPEDRALISDTAVAARLGALGDAPTRVVSLYRQSSFCSPEDAGEEL